MSWQKRFKYLVQTIFYFLVLMYYVGPATGSLNSPVAKVRAYTRAEEFDYVDWTIEAVAIKLGYYPLDSVDYLDREIMRQVVFDYLALVSEIYQTEAELSLIYSDPEIQDPETEAAPVRQRLEELYAQRSQSGPLVETVLQEMLTTVTTRLGFNPGGQTIPPVMYHSTPLPWALIVSPRDTIRQDADISLETSLTVEDHIRLEEAISGGLNVSTLVVPIGGIGTYPTMVAQTTNLNWLAEVVAHEWMHNYLTLRPLGMRYNESPELRTINETTASIAGNEIGAALIAEFFPELVPPPPAPPSGSGEEPSQEPLLQVFDFRAEMHATRIKVDEFLAQGKVEDAEEYMEARRLVFWENGYRLRKINQAYFAFYGAYADEPVGQAGEDPVGAAVRSLRSQTDSLYEFVLLISRVKSYPALLDVIETQGIP